MLAESGGFLILVIWEKEVYFSCKGKEKRLWNCQTAVSVHCYPQHMPSFSWPVTPLCVGEEGNSGGGRDVRERSPLGKKRALTFSLQWSESRHQAHRAARKPGTTVV